MQQQSIFCSWSGGKDSCLALYRAISAGVNLRYLFTMFQEDSGHSHSHHIPLEIIQKHAEMLNCHLVTRQASWQTYEENFIDGLAEIKASNVSLGVFGDIDIDGHREWVEKTCSSNEMKSLHPLWNEDRKTLVVEFVELGFVAKIVALNNEKLPLSFLGRTFDRELITELESMGIDPCGENGEFHTLVIDGPLFKGKLPVNFGKIISHDNYSFLTMELGE